MLDACDDREIIEIEDLDVVGVAYGRGKKRKEMAFQRARTTASGSVQVDDFVEHGLTLSRPFDKVAVVQRPLEGEQALIVG